MQWEAPFKPLAVHEFPSAMPYMAVLLREREVHAEIGMN